MQHNTDDKQRQSMLDRYKQARLLSDRMARVFKLIGQDRRAKRMYWCSRMIMAGTCSCCGSVHSVKIDRVCGLRLCAICAMRRSRAVAAQSITAVEWIRAHAEVPYRTCLVTLTQRNVASGELCGEVSDMLVALERMRYKRVVRRHVIASARTLEITRNHDTRTWHPHVHLLAMITEGEQLHLARTWAQLWRDVMGLDYDPVVDVREVTDQGSVYEVSKYVTKYSTLLGELSDREAAPIIAELSEAINKRQLHAWGGLWRQARKALQQVDVERMSDGALDEVVACCPDCGGELLDVLMRWTGMQYNKTKEPLSGGIASRRLRGRPPKGYISNANDPL